MSRDFIGQAIVVHMNRLKGDTGFPFQWLLPLLFFFIGLIYVYAVPHFEAPDNIPHVGMIKWIAEQRELPVQSADHEHLYGQEASQPPLYYLLMAPIWSVFDTSDFDDFFRPNPLAVVGHPSRLGNRNRVFYRQPYPPNLSGTSLALYIVRLATLGMATVTVAAVYQAARTILPQKTGFAVLATALAAFNSQFLFISASISNDNLVTMFAALICWQALLMLRDGFQTRRSLLLALLIALASLAKLGGLVLGVAVVLAGLWLFIRTRNLRGFHLLGRRYHSDMAAHRRLVVSPKPYALRRALRYCHYARLLWQTNHHSATPAFEGVRGLSHQFLGFVWLVHHSYSQGSLLCNGCALRD